MPKAYSYLRFSTPEQMKGDSFRRQKDAVEAYANEHGLELDRELTFRDLGVSAYRGANSETGRLGAFLTAVRDGLVPKGSYLLVESLDRISRQYARKAQRVLEEIVDEGICVVTLSDGRIYDTESLNRDPLTLLASLIIFIRANEESSLKSTRVHAAFDRKRKLLFSEETPTAPFTRRLPAWLCWDESKKQFAVNDERAAIIRTIFAWSDDGLGQHAIAQRLNANGTAPFGKGERWHRSYIKKLLCNPSVVGTFVPHVREESEAGVVRVPLESKPHYWPAVVEQEVYERVIARGLSVAPKGRNAGRSTKSIVAGIGRCASCGSVMARVAKGGYVYLVCSKAHAKAGCSYKTLRYSDVEMALRENAESIIQEAPRGDEAKELEAQIFSEDLRLSELSHEATELLSVSVRTKSPTVSKRLIEIESLIRQCRYQLDRLRETRNRVAGPYLLKRLADLRQALTVDDFDVGKANKALRAVVQEIKVDPDAGVMNVRWSNGELGEPIPFHSRHTFA